jgi:hypothetical protein
MSFQLYGDWTDRIAKGELPRAKPQRPQGVERNIVVTLRDWMNEKQYLHDLIASDRRYPTVNAYGPLFGSPEYSSDDIPVLDPVKNTATTFKAPVRDADMPLSLGPGHAAALDAAAAVGLLGRRAHLGHARQQPQLDVRARRPPLAGGRRARAGEPGLLQGRDRTTRRRSCSRWSAPTGTSRVRSEDAEVHVRRHLLRHPPPAVRLRRQRHAVDQRRRAGVGWLNTKMFDETGDAAKSQGWTALVLDTNGNGKRDDLRRARPAGDPRRTSASTPASTP